VDGEVVVEPGRPVVTLTQVVLWHLLPLASMGKSARRTTEPVDYAWSGNRQGTTAGPELRASAVGSVWAALGPGAAALLPDWNSFRRPSRARPEHNIRFKRSLGDPVTWDRAIALSDATHQEELL
jgi:hypothetical protein